MKLVYALRVAHRVGRSRRALGRHGKYFRNHCVLNVDDTARQRDIAGVVDRLRVVAMPGERGRCPARARGTGRWYSWPRCPVARCIEAIGHNQAIAVVDDLVEPAHVIVDVRNRRGRGGNCDC